MAAEIFPSSVLLAIILLLKSRNGNLEAISICAMAPSAIGGPSTITSLCSIGFLQDKAKHPASMIAMAERVPRLLT